MTQLFSCVCVCACEFSFFFEYYNYVWGGFMSKGRLDLLVDSNCTFMFLITRLYVLYIDLELQHALSKLPNIYVFTSVLYQCCCQSCEPRPPKVPTVPVPSQTNENWLIMFLNYTFLTEDTTSLKAHTRITARV